MPTRRGLLEARIAEKEAAQAADSRRAPAPTRRESHAFDGSSWVAQAWYRESDKLLEVNFTDGHRHLFFDVEASTWLRFTRSGSPGRFVREILERHQHRSK